MITALANGRIDAAYLPEPYVSRSRSEGIGTRWLDPNTWHPGMMVTVWVYSERFAKDTNTGERFMAALLKGTRDAVKAIDTGEGLEAMIDALMKHTPIKERRLYDGMEFVKVSPDGMIGMESLRASLDWMRRRGFVENPPELDKVVDQSFVEYALERLGEQQ